jgi:hypothetical protein
MSARLCFTTNYALDDDLLSKVDTVVDKLYWPANPTFYGPVMQLLHFFFFMYFKCIFIHFSCILGAVCILYLFSCCHALIAVALVSCVCPKDRV